MTYPRLARAALTVLIVFTVILAACQKGAEKMNENNIMEEPLLEIESRSSFDFFWKEANTDTDSPGYGLIRDRAPGNPNVSSVASVGFGLTAIAIGADRGWIDEDKARERVSGTLDTLLQRVEQVNGFFFHFLNIDSATRAGKSEVSIIDTAIALNGALTAGEYFGDEIKAKAEELYKRVDWEWFRDPNRNMFRMAYYPERGFEGHWDFYAEQLMLYFLAAASPTHPANPDMMYDFIRHTGSYKGGETFIHSWFGTMFTYQFSHAWFDLRDKADREGVDWWNNSIVASIANRQFAIDHASQYKTFGPESWGLSSSDGPKGYEGRYGASPSGYNNDAHYTDGTIAPYGAIGSINFTPTESIEALKFYYNNENLIGEYGLKDAYNLDITPQWYDPDVIGIDKGITLLMIENYRSEFIWKWFMKNKYVQAGLEKTGFRQIEQ